MAKSADAFRTISEVADWLEVPAHVLRFWESKFSHVKPVKRAGGRRYYRPNDMLLLGGIKKLLHDDGMTIKGVQKILREHGVKHVVGHSQPFDEITAAEVSDIALDVTPEPVAEEPATVLSFKRSAPEPAAKADPPVTAAPEPDPEPEITEEEAPVMPSFSMRREAEDTPAASPKEPDPVVLAEPETPKPAKVDVADDPGDDVAADAGILTKLAHLPRPVSPALAARIEPLADQLKALFAYKGSRPSD